LRGSTGKWLKKSGDRSRLKKKRNSTGPCWANIWQKLFMDGGIRSTKGKERGDGRKTGPNGNIPQDEES